MSDFQLKQKASVLPAVGVDQNGNGISQVLRQVFDEAGRVTWAKSPRGYISHYQYDVATGAVIKQIEDVDTSVTSGAPEGWVTPPSGGLNLITDFEVDHEGRVTKSLGPEHAV